MWPSWLLAALEAPEWSSRLLANVLVTLFVSLLVPAFIAGSLYFEHKSYVKEQQDAAQSAAKNAAKLFAEKEPEEEDASDTPWHPKLEVEHWQRASKLAGCPWRFDSCAELEEVLEHIWRSPLSKELHVTLATLQENVCDIRVAKVSFPMPEQVYFAIVYSLVGGGTVFGGSPLEDAVGVLLDGSDDVNNALSPILPTSPGGGTLRQRRDAQASPAKRPITETVDDPLPCLAPFHRVHDGFVMLLSLKHLPLLLSMPEVSWEGSSFYIYPARALEKLPDRPSLVRFARVDRRCVACADCRRLEPLVVYVESDGTHTEDDEDPLTTVGEMIANICCKQDDLLF